MTDNKESVTLTDAMEQVKTAVTRIALIHLGFSKTLVEELGEEIQAVEENPDADSLPDFDFDFEDKV